MMTELLHFLLPVAFTFFIACTLTTLVSSVALLLFKRRRLNQAMRHPYLQQRPWEALPWSVRATILLDYFLRLAFPRKTAWMFGDANRLLAHVAPAEVSSSLKWPVYGLWVGCGVGLIAMVTLWLLLLLAPA